MIYIAIGRLMNWHVLQLGITLTYVSVYFFKRENQTHKFIINHLRIWNLNYTRLCFIVRKYCVICPTMATRRHYHISREKSLGSHIWTVVSAVVVMLEKTSTSNAEYILTWRLPPRLVVPTKGKLTLMIHSGHSRSLRHKYYYVLQ